MTQQNQFDNVRDFTIDLIRRLEVAEQTIAFEAPDLAGNPVNSRNLVDTLDRLIELEHEMHFVDSVYNDDDVDPDDLDAPFNSEGMFQQWFTLKCIAVEAAIAEKTEPGLAPIALSELYAECTEVEFETDTPAMRYKDDFIDLDTIVMPTFRIRGQNRPFTAEIPARIFKAATPEHIADRIDVWYQNNYADDNWVAKHTLGEDRQLDPRVIPDYDLTLRRQVRKQK